MSLAYKTLGVYHSDSEVRWIQLEELKFQDNLDLLVASFQPCDSTNKFKQNLYGMQFANIRSMVRLSKCSYVYAGICSPTCAMAGDLIDKWKCFG